MRIFQKGFHFGQDGPGNRLVYHLSGCNMKCLWCSNPEGMDADGGAEQTVSALAEECRRSKAMFFSGGGVTFTGGEATMQHEELSALLKILKADGIHTAIETNGTSKRLSELMQYVDYLMMDFKHYDSEILKRFTGVGNETVKQNFEYFCKTGRQQHIRIPLISGFNAESPEAFAAYFAKSDTKNTVFEFLPYHEYGKGKWKTEYKITNGFVPEETLAEYSRVFRAFGLTTITT